MPALFATSSDLARKALITSGPGPMFGQDETVNGSSSSSPAYVTANSCACCDDAIDSDAPCGTAVGSGSLLFKPPVAADPVATPQPASPATAAPPNRDTKLRRDKPAPARGVEVW